jgi:hypothetical protein
MSLFAVGTGCNTSKENAGQAKVDDRIILINIGNSDRLEIAKAIEKVSHCSPKIIAINAIFVGTIDSNSDLALSNAIKYSQNVIIPFEVNGNGFIKSNELFANGCLAQGAVEMWPADDVINTFKVSFYSDKMEELVWAFPFTIVNYFDIGNPSYLRETKPNQDYYIKFSQNSLDNNGISLDSLNRVSCEVLKGSIVLMGDIVYNDENGFLISDDSNIRVSSTVIFANIISTILSHDFTELNE